MNKARGKLGNKKTNLLKESFANKRKNKKYKKNKIS